MWWGGPLPAVEDLVPLNRYLTEAIQAEYHPAAWPLVEAGGVYWGWPRWIGFHYWLVPRAAAGTVGRGWTLDDALELAAGGLLAPPASGGLLLELAAGRMEPLTPPDDAVEDAGAGGDDQTGVEPAAAQLAAALGRLRPLLAAGGAVGQRLVDAGFGLAGGFGPALGHWAVSPPLSGRGRPDEHSLELLVPPAWMGDPAAVPVLSAGAYVIPRKDGPDEGVRAQLAVELARHLSTWQGDAAVARLLAVPAHTRRWNAGAPGHPWRRRSPSGSSATWTAPRPRACEPMDVPSRLPGPWTPRSSTIGGAGGSTARWTTRPWPASSWAGRPLLRPWLEQGMQVPNTKCNPWHGSCILSMDKEGSTWPTNCRRFRTTTTPSSRTSTSRRCGFTTTSITPPTSTT